jgi:hypothetical protein
MHYLGFPLMSLYAYFQAHRASRPVAQLDRMSFCTSKCCLAVGRGGGVTVGERYRALVSGDRE